MTKNHKSDYDKLLLSSVLGLKRIELYTQYNKYMAALGDPDIFRTRIC